MSRSRLKALGGRRSPDFGSGFGVYQGGETMAKEKRRGNREIRKPKTAKSAAAAPVSPFAPKAPSAVTTPLKRK
jgi:hypothetical protein